MESTFEGASSINLVGFVMSKKAAERALE
jgi:hypothetical protein